MTADALFDAYLGVNILLGAAALLWAAVRSGLRRSPLRRAFPAQLRLLYGLFAALALAPAAGPAFSALRRFAGDAATLPPGLADYTLAQYLAGRFPIPPSQFEALWTARARFVAEVATLAPGAGLWVGGVLALGLAWYLARLLRDVLRLGRVIVGGHVWRRGGRVTILLCDRTAVPFSVRAPRRHYVVLPSAMLARYGDLRIAIAHELQHVRQGDAGVELALGLLHPFFFWNPGFRYLRGQAAELRELACDAQVLGRGRIGLAAYCDCLLRASRASRGTGETRPVSVPGVALIAPAGRDRAARALRHRIDAMLAGSARAPGRALTALMALALMAGMGGVGLLAQRPGDWSQDRLMLSAIVNLERLDRRSAAPGR